MLLEVAKQIAALASQGEGQFLVAGPCSLPCFLAVELQGFALHQAQRCEQLVAALFLRIHVRHLLNPAHPPRAVLADHCRIGGGHRKEAVLIAG
jgi:hypothetical protein